LFFSSKKFTKKLGRKKKNNLRNGTHGKKKDQRKMLSKKKGIGKGKKNDKKKSD
jgi:hypothetical protein